MFHRTESHVLRRAGVSVGWVDRLRRARRGPSWGRQSGAAWERH